jgi:uroporphyrinogen III methyltransferase / synthase
VTVYLVGAGPGDPGLITVHGAEVLAQADLVIHDRLADSSLLELAPTRARRIDVGKAPGGPVHQDEINDLLVTNGRAGLRVVRLKGGDPFVFGRGGEEALALQAAGVPFEVVPGITSAIAVPAYAGVPVTHRGVATSFTVVTGHSRHAVDQETNWDALARTGGTIVVLMGVAHRAEIAERLMAAGLAVDTPVAAVRWGTRPEQTSIRVPLNRLGATPLEPPVTLVIGGVADLDLAWYERRPLFGKRIVVTRSQTQASSLSQRLRELGARPVEVPTIRIEQPADGGAGLDRGAAGLVQGAYEWLVFTSANAADALLGRVPDARRLGSVQIAVVGEATAEAVARYRLVPDLVAPPGRQEAAGLVEVMPAPATPGGRVLFPRAAAGRPVLVEGLSGAGWCVDLVEAYRTVPATITGQERAAIRGANAISFTSSSTVTGFIEAFGADAVPPVVVCIGPVTARSAAEAGLKVDAVADRPGIEGVIDALLSVL